MRRRLIHRLAPVLALLAACTAGPAPGAQPAPLTAEELRAVPYPTDLVAAPSGSRVAWIFSHRGARNVWVADGPEWTARAVTDFKEDDGQELTDLAFSRDGGTLVFARGGDHDANWAGESLPNPNGNGTPPKLEVFAVAAAGGPAKAIGEGDEPVASPDGSRVVFLKDHQVWSAPPDGAKPAARLFFARGKTGPVTFSPDGKTLAFSSDRTDHAFIGLYSLSDEGQPVRWLSPSTARDIAPRFSPDGTEVAFVRLGGRGGAPLSLLTRHPEPWEIRVASVKTGASRVVWKSGETMADSYPSTLGASNLTWAAGNRLVFQSYADGWPHLYSVSAAPGSKDAPLLLTPGPFMVEFVALSPDRRFLVYNANAGNEAGDIDRRHLFRVPIDAAAPRPLTAGTGIEWNPVLTADGGTVAFLASGPQVPAQPMIRPLSGGSARPLAPGLVPPDFPAARLVIPKSVSWQAPDGVEVHGQIFAAPGGAARKPAVIFVHGGPPRQMLLGWHYRPYYANAYAVNQILARGGFVVLSVNYRLGIGYGHAFHHPERAGTRGASEYQDVLSGARFLQALPGVDGKRIGIWGGSYGGYLVALALARNSDVFAAGVDLHGVHDRSVGLKDDVLADLSRPEKADAAEALRVAWESSPLSSRATWKSPVLFIHGDDDRNVRFHQTVDLVNRLRDLKVPYEEIVFPDEIHDFLLERSWLAADRAVVDYMERLLRP